MHPNVKKWSLNFVKVAIAVIGLWIVVWAPWSDEPALVWRDRATLNANIEIRGIKILDPVPVWLIEKSHDPALPPNTATIALTTFSNRKIHVQIDGHDESWPLTGPELRRALAPVGYPTADIQPNTGLPPLRWLQSFRTPEPQFTIPENLLKQTPAKPGETSAVVAQVGLRRLVREADPWLLVAAWSMLCIPFFVSAWRWRKLMQPQGIFLPFRKCLALTFVGQFYSTFLPGTTSGDLVKIVYTSQVTGSKTKSTVTILLDRVIGLIALAVIAGIASTCMIGSDPLMLWFSLGIAASLATLVVLSIIYFSHRLRRLTGLTWLLNHKAVPDFVRHADEVLHAYRGHWWILTEAFLASLITMVVIPISAFLAGRAFGIHAHIGYYFAYVPLAILAASVPISPPQGIGITEGMLLRFCAASCPSSGTSSAPTGSPPAPTPATNPPPNLSKHNHEFPTSPSVPSRCLAVSVVKKGSQEIIGSLFPSTNLTTTARGSVGQTLSQIPHPTHPDRFTRTFPVTALISNAAVPIGQPSTHNPHSSPELNTHNF